VVAHSELERRFDDLYSAHREVLHAYFLGKTSDPELALDLLQDTFIRVWRNLSTVADLPAERQRVWMFSVARNLVIDHYRAQATRVAAREALELATSDAEAPPADAQVTQLERLQAVHEAIRRLPDELRTVLVLQQVGERTSREIGEFLGRPAGTIRYQLAEARRRLARDLRLQEAVNQ
jgi:RNA polymerase sigma-70 factor (ECF subfamily)